MKILKTIHFEYEKENFDMIIHLLKIKEDMFMLTAIKITRHKKPKVSYDNVYFKTLKEAEKVIKEMKRK